MGLTIFAQSVSGRTFDDPHYEGGANPTSLSQAQKNFMEFGACDINMKQNTRLPNMEEPKDKNWKPYD
jgi:hypothetical protein